MTALFFVAVRDSMPPHQKADLISGFLDLLAQRYGMRWRVSDYKTFPDLERTQYIFEPIGGDISAWAADLKGDSLPPFSAKYSTFQDSSGCEFHLN